MTDFHRRQIEQRLEVDFEPFVDLSDVEHHQERQLESFRKTRALTALVACNKSGNTVEEAAKFVTDESGDQGIDGVAPDPLVQRLFLIQSKTSTGGPSPTEAMKFKEGIRLFIDSEWDRMGPKVQARKEEFEEIFSRETDDPKFNAIFAYLGDKPIAKNDEAYKLLKDFEADVNANGVILEVSFMGIRELFEIRNAASAPKELEHELYFEKWNAPFSSFGSEIVGVVSAQEIFEMVQNCGPMLYDKNIRKALGDTQVNSDMRNTLESDSESFWYYNNGITIVASEIKPSVPHPKSSASFGLKGLSVVNGAQTCSTIYSFGKQQGEAASSALDSAYVTVKVVSLAGRDSAFEQLVTRFTNTQNRITGREFAALDPLQQGIQDALLSENIYYSFRTGDKAPDEFREEFTIDEATRCLSCMHSVALATRAKRNLGSLWGDIHAAPYTQIFNAQTDPAAIWNAVRAWREVEELTSAAAKSAPSSRVKKIYENALYVYASLVFRRIKEGGFHIGNFDANVSKWFEENNPTLRSLLDEIMKQHEKLNRAGYPANFFKNAKKVEELATKVEREMSKRP
ncbi:AIPR family protein [Corynebacterium sp. Marseille-P3884]|uniref:AIPR family protein n=1 Tax=Corynebacterium sp. Marseille-P3884 TaxID=2495409 RepID=UPI001B325F81|nr:AIPR family protein [Corynebacterium sp. Marseille-P3884]MBP3949127.1 AIPR family protein [Corynebacterium sp. Marseille-P3884]